MENIEKCLVKLIQNPYNSILNFDLAYTYELEKQYAIAFSFYLRCAEFTEDNILASEALLRCSLCINSQGGRDVKELYLIKHAITASPNSVEPYYIASLYFSWRSGKKPEERMWLDSYMYACMGINIIENNLAIRPFKKDIRYKKVDIYYQKAYAGTNIGKIDEAREIYNKILDSFEITDKVREFIITKKEKLPKIFNHKIPRNIFLSWEKKIDTISPEMLNYINSWNKHNNNYKINFYDSSERYNFIKDNFDFDVLDVYNRLKPGAFKCDLWRCCILYIYGGFYADIDTLCLSSLDVLKEENVDFICPIDLNPNINCQYNLCNGFIGSIPKHPILKMCIDHIVNTIKQTQPTDNVIITNICGPGCLGINMNKYLNREWNTSFVGKEGIVNDIKFLKFNGNNGFIYDISNNINILQNKNGNPELQTAYKNECSKLNNFICYGKFGEFTKIENLLTYNTFDYICNDINNNINNINISWGWCTNEKAIKIQSFIKNICSTFTNPTCVEIGVYGGMSCIPVLIELYNANKGILHAIDPWDNIEATKGYNDIHYDFWSTVDLNYFYNFFKDNVSKYNFSKFVNIIKLPSDKAPNIYNINYLYIDGQHTEQAFRDINKYATNVVKDGIVILDDINWSDITKKMPDYIIKLGFEKIDEINRAFIFKRIDTLPKNITLNINEKNLFYKSNIISNIKPNIIAIDDFYKDPDQIRDYALSLTYQPPENHGAVGYRCDSGRKIQDGTKELFEKLLHSSIPDGNNIGEWNYSTNGCFQWCNASVPIVYHSVSQQYAGIIYLTPDAPPNTGTSFFRHKKYKLRNSEIFSKSDWYESDLNYKEPHLDKTQWEVVDSIGNVYNRLVIFDAQYIHAVSEYFGEDINNSRLFQLFFFNIN